MRKKKDKKVHSIGFQFANSTTKVYYNDPQIAVEIVAPTDTSPYRVKVNGESIGCETIAKVIIDGKIHTFADPFIKGSGFNARDEVTEWRKHIGLECFKHILHAVDPEESAFAEFLKAPFKNGIEAEKKKRMLEMKVAKNVREQREADNDKEQEHPKRIDDLYRPGYPTSYTKDSYSIDSGVPNPQARLDYDNGSWVRNK